MMTKVETATCRNCGCSIEHGRWAWLHEATGIARCFVTETGRVVLATPEPERVPQGGHWMRLYGFAHSNDDPPFLLDLIELGVQPAVAFLLA